MITVALPVYNMKDIAWLCMESLSRQKGGEWELIVFEETHPQQLHKKFFESFILPGCKSVKYFTQDKKLSLSEKWHFIGQKAKGDMMCLCAGDNYYHPYMIADAQKAHDEGIDWFYTTKGYWYNFISKKLVMYDKPDYAAGLQMAIDTNLAREIPNEPRLKLIDKWIVINTRPKNPKIDSSLHYQNTLCTHGFNTISKERGELIDNLKFPFLYTKKKLEDVIPKKIADRCLNI